LKAEERGLEGVAEAVDFVVGRVGGVETDVYPVALDVDAFRFESDRVEVDGVDFAAGGEVDDVKPIVAWAVAIGQVGIATFNLAALGHFDAMDGGGVKYIGIGEVDFAVLQSREAETLEVHGAATAAAIGIEVVAVGVETPVLGNRE
jgi:hypothetical protein